MPRSRLIAIVVAVLVVAVLASGAVWFQVARNEAGVPGADNAQVMPGSESIGGAYTLVDQTGGTVTQDAWPQRWKLVYFGYTFCPDVCPTELASMAAAVDLLGEAADRVKPVFISVDPERDTVDRLAEYVPAFHPDMVGLTGSEAQVKAAAQAFKVYYRKVDPADDASPDYYLMDHSSFVYLISPDGRTVNIFRPNTAPETMAEVMRARIDAAPTS
ncbi:MAG: SCO family protein [Azospirillaceae bacterium]